MTLMLLMVVEIGDALAIGFALAGFGKSGMTWKSNAPSDLRRHQSLAFRNLDLLLSDGASEGRT